jgi:hypothetical protein
MWNGEMVPIRSTSLILLPRLVLPPRPLLAIPRDDSPPKLCRPPLILPGPPEGLCEPRLGFAVPRRGVVLFGGMSQSRNLRIKADDRGKVQQCAL